MTDYYTSTNVVASIYNIETSNNIINEEVSNDVIVFDSSDIRLGISTATPEYSLDVSGTIKTNNIRINNYGEIVNSKNNTIISISNDQPFLRTYGSNIGLGSSALNDLSFSISSSNTAIGYNAVPVLNDISYANHTTGIGNNSLRNLTIGNRNTALGSRSGRNLYNGLDNIYVGYDCGPDICGTYSEQIVIGAESSSKGNNNIVIGYNIVGRKANSVSIGNASITDYYFDNSGVGNSTTHVGNLNMSGTLKTNSIISDGSSISFNEKQLADVSAIRIAGYGANINTSDIGTKNNTIISVSNNKPFLRGSANNVALGEYALGNFTFSSLENNNTAIGRSSLRYITNGINNTAVGRNAGYDADSSSNNNTYIGKDAGFTNSNSVVNQQTIIGALAKSTYDNNIVIGYNTVGRNADSVSIGNAYITDYYFDNSGVGNSTTHVGNLNMNGKLRTNSITTTSGTDIDFNYNSLRNVRYLDISGYGATVNSKNNTIISISNDEPFLRADSKSNIGIGKNAFGDASNGEFLVNSQIGANQLGGNYNIAIGENALKQLPTPTDISRQNFGNVAIGRDALRDLSNGLYNTAVGDNAGVYRQGYNSRMNTYIGAFAIPVLTNTNKELGQIAIGSYSRVSKDYSIAIGYEAESYGDRSIAIGKLANSTYNNNIVIGANVVGRKDNSVSIGDISLTDYYFDNSGVGDSTTHVGNLSMNGTINDITLLKDSSNILCGNNLNTDFSNIYDYNCLFGQNILELCDNSNIVDEFSKGSNTVMGYEALKQISQAGYNIAIGRGAGYTNIGSSVGSIYIGADSGCSIDNSSNDISYEIVIGAYTSGNGSNTVTIGNSDISNYFFNSNPNSTTHVGNLSMSGNISMNGTINDITLLKDSNNILCGNNLNTDFSNIYYYNCLFGQNILSDCDNSNNDDIYTKGSNTVMGYDALAKISEGGYNVAIGRGAGYINIGSSVGSIYIGADSGCSIDNSSNDISYEIVIGTDAQGHGSHTVTIGDSKVTDYFFNSNQNSTTHLGNLSMSGTFNDITLLKDSNNILFGNNLNTDFSNIYDYNCLFGQNILSDCDNSNNDDIYTKGSNTVMGYDALAKISEGGYNVAIGRGAGYINIGSSVGSIYIGADSGCSIDNSSNDISYEIVIGTDAQGHGSHTVTIGDSKVTDYFFNSNQNSTTHVGDISSGGTLYINNINTYSGDTINFNNNAVSNVSYLEISGFGYDLSYLSYNHGRINTVISTTGVNESYTGSLLSLPSFGIALGYTISKNIGSFNLIFGSTIFINNHNISSITDGICENNIITGVATFQHPSNATNNIAIGTNINLTYKTHPDDNSIINISQYDSCIYIGHSITFRNNSNDTANNEIVIGSDAIGNGDNTVTIGNNITEYHFNSHSSSKLFIGSAILPTSDDRFKHNEVDISGLKIIRQLNPQFYQKTNKMLDEDYHGDLSNIDWHYQAGFIAQEVLNSDVSYLVHKKDDYYDASNNLIKRPYHLNYNDFHAYNMAAIQELDSIVSNQENIINDLNKEIIDLKQENSSIKSALNQILDQFGYNTI